VRAVRVELFARHPSRPLSCITFSKNALGTPKNLFVTNFLGQFRQFCFLHCVASHIKREKKLKTKIMEKRKFTGNEMLLGSSTCFLLVVC
jgi:hypothetical protein